MDTEEENKKLISIIDIESGDIVAEIEYEKKTTKFSRIHLSSIKDENYLLFRFIELKNPERK